jgi:hypothetical protein
LRRGVGKVSLHDQAEENRLVPLRPCGKTASRKGALFSLLSLWLEMVTRINGEDEEDWQKADEPCPLFEKYLAVRTEVRKLLQMRSHK